MSPLASFPAQVEGAGDRPAPAATNSTSTTLSAACRLLADVAEPPNMRQSFEAGLTVALLQNQLSMIESTTGMPLLNRNRAGQVQSITLTGWTALFGITAMVALVAAGSVYGYRRYKGINERDYTLVVKGRH